MQLAWPNELYASCCSSWCSLLTLAPCVYLQRSQHSSAPNKNPDDTQVIRQFPSTPPLPTHLAAWDGTDSICTALSTFSSFTRGTELHIITTVQQVPSGTVPIVLPRLLPVLRIIVPSCPAPPACDIPQRRSSRRTAQSLCFRGKIRIQREEAFRRVRRLLDSKDSEANSFAAEHLWRSRSRNRWNVKGKSNFEDPWRLHFYEILISRSV